MEENSQKLYYPEGNMTNGPVYGAAGAAGAAANISNSNASGFIPKYKNHAILIQGHLDQVKVVKVPGNPQNTSHMLEEYGHYNEIEKIAEDRQKLIMAEIKSINAAFRGGSRRKTRRKITGKTTRNKH